MLNINTLPGPNGTLTLCDLTGQILLVKKFYEPGTLRIQSRYKKSEFTLPVLFREQGNPQKKCLLIIERRRMAEFF